MRLTSKESKVSPWKWMATSFYGWLAGVGMLHLWGMASAREVPAHLVALVALIAALLCAMNWRRMTRRRPVEGPVLPE
jgi:uncharacterized membrane protein AbrB (regulator of aidB expression)